MVTINDCKADGLANELFTSLTADAPVPPSVDLSDTKFDFSIGNDNELYSKIKSVSLEELTEGALDGEGVFDRMMAAVDLHIQREFKNNRITGSQYAEVYTAVVNEVLSKATQFVLAKDQAKWAAITAQMQARVAEIAATEALINLEKTKAETLKMIFDMRNSGAQYGLTKMQIANADATHCQIKAQTGGELYKVEYLMPAELAIQEYQRMQVLPSTVAINNVQSDRVLPAEAAIKEYENHELQPLEKALQKYQLDITGPMKTSIDNYQLTKMLPVQLGKEQHLLNFQMPAQTRVLSEQAEVGRAQTMDTRSDGLTIVKGMMGKEKESVSKDIEAKTYNIEQKLPIELDLVKEQRETARAQTKDTRTDGSPVNGLIQNQRLVMAEQIDLIREQREAERSKTLNARTDGQLITGSVGKQKDLYTQQIDSFIKDSQHKVAKMYLDTWITQKTLDENLPVPDSLENPQISSIIASVRTKNAL